MKRLVLYICITLLTGCVLSPSSEKAQSSKTYKVLLIQSSAAPGFVSTCQHLIEEEFKKSGIPVEIKYILNFSQDQEPRPAIMALINKLEPYMEDFPDLILTVNDDAFNFLLATELPLTYAVPIVFNNLTFPLKKLLEKHTNITGQLEKVDYRQAYELAKRLFGEIEELQLVYGFQRLDWDFDDEAQRQIRQFPELSLVRNLSAEGPESTPLDTIRPPESLEHPLKVYSDLVTIWPFDQFTRFYDREKSPFPIRRFAIKPAEEYIYTPFFSYYYIPFININNAYFPSVQVEGIPLRSGCIGGYMNPIENQAATAVATAVRILKGEPVSHFPIDTAERIPLFDWNALQHWKISPDLLPPGSRIINKPFLLEYRNTLLVSGTLLILLIAFLIYYLVRYSLQTKFEGNRLFRRFKQEQEHMQTTVNSINEGIISFDQNALVTSINLAAINLLQLDQKTEKIAGQHINALFRLSPPGPANWFWLYELMEKAHKSRQKQLIPEGSLLHLRNRTVLHIAGMLRALFVNGEYIGSLFTFRNCTDQFRQSQFLEFSMAAGDVYTWQYHEKNREMALHPSFFIQNKIEYTHAGIAYPHFLELIHPEDRPVWTTVFQDMRANRQADKKNVQLRLLLPDKITWYEFRISTMPATNLNQDSRFYGICLSIQMLKETEESMLQVLHKAKESNRMKTEFLATMSHEIRTPLNAIVGFSTIMDQASSPQEREQFMQIISNNCDLLLQTINDILDISRVESGYPFQYKVCHLHTFLSDVWKEKQSLFIETNVEFFLELPEEGHLIETDTFRLRQLVDQLLKNASQFTPSGSVTLGYKIAKDKEHIQVYVRDTGIGIAPENREIVFERFYKLNNFTAGGGLGLSLCREIVNRMHGTITLSDGTDGGTCVTVILPIHQSLLQNQSV